MPKKIRELKQMLRKAGFTYEPAKGSHTKWSHVLLSKKLVIPGNDGNDAKPYLESQVKDALQILEETKRQTDQQSNQEKDDDQRQ
ncbi:MAG: type II toxin-antitoxin system HicA family toxin [Cyanophyceae cyanobacterium]